MKNKGLIFSLIICLFLVTFIPQNIFSQVSQIVNEKIQASSLTNNLFDDSTNRAVVIYLPPSYNTQPKKRYPVVYLLHGWVANSRGEKENCFIANGIFPAMDTWLKDGELNEMILVLPDSFNKLGGSWYTNSRAAGNWADYIAKDVVEHVDTKFRTIPNCESRALVGHSMGGYGALRIGIMYSDIFSCIGILSGKIDFGESAVQNNALFYARMSKLKTWEDFNNLAWGMQLYLAQCVAFAPNTKKPPFYCDFPFKEGQVINNRVFKKFIKNDGFHLIKKNVESIREMNVIYFDCGTNDPFIEHAKKLDSVLEDLEIEHVYNEFRGTHFSGILGGTENALTLFSMSIINE
jgi:enterochelin esterase-like enzyme